MENEIFGDKLFKITDRTKNHFFTIGRLTQLSYHSFILTKQQIQNHNEENIDLQYPIGQRPSGEPMLTNSSFPKAELIANYDYLSDQALAINGIYSLVTGIEVMFSELIIEMIQKYPNKLPGNRKIEISKILNCETLESVHIVAAQSFIRDLTYKSPKEFADSVENIFNLNLLEVAQFQKYIEIKATRDIFIHNQGITNEIYVLKAGSLSRARAGEVLPINNNYFLQSYETCIQLTEFLRDHLHDKWHSPENEKWKQQFKENSNPINPSSPPHQQV